MKVLHILDTFAAIGGIETYVLELLPLLEAHGCENIVIYRQEHPETITSLDVPAYHIAVTDMPKLDYARIMDVIHRHQPTVLYVHKADDPVILMATVCPVPMVVYVHGFVPVCPGLAKYFRRGDIICDRAFGLGCIPNIYLRRCASARHPWSVYRIMQHTSQYLEVYRTLPCILVASNYMRSLMIQNGIPMGHVHVAALPKVVAAEASARARQADEIPTVLFVGRLESEKGVPYLLRATTRIKMPCQVVIAGDGTKRYDYEFLVQSLGISERVRFLGWLDGAELAEAFRSASVVVVPSIMPEPFGRVGTEAMAHGVPVVAFDVGGISDWLQDSWNGFLVPPQDVNQLAMQIERLLTNTALAHRLGSNGRDYLLEHFSPQQHVQYLLSMFQSVL